jgi:hypothetical protein
MPHAKKVSCTAGFRLGIDSKADYISELTCLKFVNASKFKVFHFMVKQL